MGVWFTPNGSVNRVVFIPTYRKGNIPSLAKPLVNCLLNGDRIGTLACHLERNLRFVHADPSAGRMFIDIAAEQVLMTEILPAFAITIKLVENLRDLLCDPVSNPRFSLE